MELFWKVMELYMEYICTTVFWIEKFALQVYFYLKRALGGAVSQFFLLAFMISQQKSRIIASWQLISQLECINR